MEDDHSEYLLTATTYEKGESSSAFLVRDEFLPFNSSQTTLF